MIGKNQLLAILLITFSLKISAQECQLKSHEELGREILDEVQRNPFNCNKQNVHLTFDDGPSPAITPGILSELNKRGIKASFFVTTTNLEPSSKNAETNAALLRDMMKTGHLIANHGHDHSAYDLRMSGDGTVLESGFSQAEREKQISKSVALLDKATGNKFSTQPLKLFRFPYGRGAMPSAKELSQMSEKGLIKFSSNDYAKQLAEYRRLSPALQTLAGSGFSHLGWNHDSNDSSLGVGMPEKNVVKNYILKNLKTLCQAKTPQVALFHDIKQINTVAIPVIADIGKCLGLKFTSPQEMNQDSEALVKSGVLIRKSAVDKAPVETLEELLSSLEKGKPKIDCEPETQKECFSEQYKKRYRECEGGDSICLGGRWYSRRDPIVILNCKLSD